LVLAEKWLSSPVLSLSILLSICGKLPPPFFLASNWQRDIVGNDGKLRVEM
jgi:hypothetical protein